MTDYSRFILKPDVRKTSEIKHHYDNAPGLRYVFLDAKKLPETSLYTIVRTVKSLDSGQDPYIDAHMHNCDSEFLFIGDNEDLTGLTAYVWLDGEKHIVEAPASVFIPKNVLHNVQLAKGSGKFINIVLGPDYNKTLQTHEGG
jgi:2-isopropylmalate synthase